MAARPPHLPSTPLEGDHTNGFSLSVSSSLVEAIVDQVVDELAARLPIPPEPYLTVSEAAEYLACRPKRIYELKAQGRVAHYRDGTRLLFRREDLDAALVRRSTECG